MKPDAGYVLCSSAMQALPVNNPVRLTAVVSNENVSLAYPLQQDNTKNAGDASPDKE